jgi:hypothetical protein
MSSSWRGLAGACAEVAVVEHEAGVAGLVEPLGERVESHVAHAAEAVTHHDGRERSLAVGGVEPGDAIDPA